MNKIHLAMAAAAAAGTLSLSMPAPASADGAASTRTIILGAAVLAGLAIESNVARKHATANRVSGYLPDGSTVYGDGHVVTGNGYSYIPANNGQRVSCNNGNCFLVAANTGNGTYNGNAYGYGTGTWNGDRDDSGNH